MLEVPDQPVESTKTTVLKESKKTPRKKKYALVAIMLLFIAAIFGIKSFIHASTHESTDNAFIDGHIIQVSPKISGNIAKVYVEDNQKVKKGDLLVEIDPQDFEAKIEQAQASLQAAIARQKGASINVKLTDVTSAAGLTQARAGFDFSKSGIDIANEEIMVSQSKLEENKAKVASAKANAILAKQDLERLQKLYNLGAISKQQIDTAIANSQAADAALIAANKAVASSKYQLNQAQVKLKAAYASTEQAAGMLSQANIVPENIAISQSQLETSSAEIKRLQAALKQAEYDLSYTRIYAPSSGYVTRRVAERGAFTQTGQALMAIVPDRVWITANFKETQLTHMKPGQLVSIKVDAYPNKRFKGHVDSIQRGTGAKFSLLPPENAVGSYVKVVQRVPVKIVFDEIPDPNFVLAPGMSVIPEIKVK